MNWSRSKQMYEVLSGLTPGGVSSPVRRFEPYPISMCRGEKCNIIDVDGNSYLDMCMAYGPLIIGHAHPDVTKVVVEQVRKGSVYGAPSIPELELMNIIRNNVPCADTVRLTNSGTEATMHAIRLARGVTARDKIVKIKGGFHGSHDSVLAVSDDHMEPSVPSSEGVPISTAANTYCVDYNDIWQMEEVLKNGDIAAVIMEPIMGNMGVISPEKGYLQNVRKLTKMYGSLLIFDEVITGFRVSDGGAQRTFSVTPDICTLGKIIGGGYPIGALAGRREIMGHLAPEGEVYLAGTFAGNPISATAGKATIESAISGYSALSDKTDMLVSAMRDSMSDRNIEGSIVSENSMFQIFFDIERPKNAAEAGKADAKMFDGLFKWMLSHGIYIPPSRFEVNFLSTVHDRASLNFFAELFDAYLGSLSK